jgi:hypothetical protein
MNQVIVYENDESGITVVMPTKEALNLIGINAIALKDVPAGKPFKIIDASELPQDHTFFNAWEVDPNSLNDGVGADYGTGSNNDVIAWDENKKPIIKYAS